MKRNLKIAAMTALCMSLSFDLMACTSAIISGRITADGRPLLWKHRDTKVTDNRVDYVSTCDTVKYAFLAVVSCSDKSHNKSWMGTNEVGFSIINTDSPNMERCPEDGNDMDGKVMYRALACCRTVADFDRFLEENKPIGVSANFGVIDAEGGAAYYETSSYEWVKQDVNDPDVAPLGYKVYTNFSPSGKVDGGGGYIRYCAANDILEHHVLRGGKVTPQWIFNSLSRSFYNPLLGVDLVKHPEQAPGGWYYDADFIPRKSTASSAVIKGVKVGENPLLTTMWTVLGYPPVSVAVPLMVAYGENQPSVTSRISSTDGNCLMSNAVRERRAKVFPVTRGHGPNYVRVSEIFNGDGTGYMQRLAPVENKLFEDFNALAEQWYESGKVNVSQLKSFYDRADFGLNVK